MHEKNQKDWKEESRMLLQAANNYFTRFEYNNLVASPFSSRKSTTKLGQINEYAVAI